MGRKSVTELQDDLAQERDDNARLYAKVNNLRAKLAELDDPDDSAELSANSAKRLSPSAKSPFFASITSGLQHKRTEVEGN